MMIPKRAEVRTWLAETTDNAPPCIVAACYDLGVEFSIPKASVPEGREGHERAAVALVAGYYVGKTGKLPSLPPTVIGDTEESGFEYVVTVAYF